MDIVYLINPIARALLARPAERQTEPDSVDRVIQIVNVQP